jgi:Fe-Mn family superoxide dismutase
MKIMNFELPKLPYANDALVPFISVETIEYHYGKHHQTYVTNLNGLIEGTQFENSSLEEIIVKSDGSIKNNAAQVYNHTFFWNCLALNAGGEPTGAFSKLLLKNDISFSKFKEKFSAAAVGLFGSGWVWGYLNKEGKLEIKQYSNAGNPLMDGYTPLLTIDVWEHAYYIDYRNNRKSFVENFWNYVNWSYINSQIK